MHSNSKLLQYYPSGVCATLVRSLIGLSLAALALASAVAPAPTFAANANADAVFFAAREAFRTGERQRLARAVGALQGHPLHAWAEYWALRLRLDERDDSGVQDYLDRHPGAYLTEKLRGDRLRFLAMQRKWDVFLRELPGLAQPDNEIDCFAAQAKRTPETVRPLWIAGQELPQACETLIDQWVAQGNLTVDEVWVRIRRLLENKRYAGARYAAAYLPKSENFDGNRLDAIAQTPDKYLDKLPTGFADSRGGRELALFAVHRLARTEPQEAAQHFQRIEARFRSEERAYAWGQIAWQAAFRHRPEALRWYDKAAATVLGEEALAWQARAALRAQDWHALQRAITAMPTPMAAQNDWIYWQARILATQGKRDEARALYAKIGGQPNFYSNLADDELGRPIGVPPTASPLKADELLAAETHPGLQRAIALMRVDMRMEGIREWNWSLRGMSDRQLLAAATLAKNHEIWDRAINTADRTQEQHDYSLRYLAPFRRELEPKAAELSLDSGWVYGLMRQESRFIMNAKSNVGAQGLMQLMPATAQWVAKKISLPNFTQAKVTEMDTNITLGTHYMRMVLQSLDNHPVLASAAYNAGPGRAQRWRADTPLEAAIYIESIPFSETRDYVKKVMSNAVYYNALFQSKPQSLKARLGVIRARGVGGSGVGGLP